MTLSYTHMARYIDNEARAYAHYVKHDETAYPTDNLAAPLVYGRFAHSILSGKESDISDLEEQSMYLRGNEGNGLKAAFKGLHDAVVLAGNARDEILAGEHYETEVPLEDDTFNGRLDVLSTSHIIDYKFVNVSNFDKVWAGDRYDDWIYSTHYALQAAVYMALVGRDIKYNVIAIDKKSLERRVYDMSDLAYNMDMADDIETLVARINAIERGEIEPVFKNDNSEWSKAYMSSLPISSGFTVAYDGRL